MSLRIWTVTIALAGLALYTLSLLPVSGDSSSQPIAPVPQAVEPRLPSTFVQPVNYGKSTLREFTPESIKWSGPEVRYRPLSPSWYANPSKSIPERVRASVHAPAHPFITSVFLEVLS